MILSLSNIDNCFASFKTSVTMYPRYNSKLSKLYMPKQHFQHQYSMYQYAQIQMHIWFFIVKPHHTKHSLKDTS